MADSFCWKGCSLGNRYHYPPSTDEGTSHRQVTELELESIASYFGAGFFLVLPSGPGSRWRCRAHLAGTWLTGWVESCEREAVGNLGDVQWGLDDGGSQRSGC